MPSHKALRMHGRIWMLLALAFTVVPMRSSTAGEASPGKGGNAPVYGIYPLRNGVCTLAGNHAFDGGDNAQTYGYALDRWPDGIIGGKPGN